MRKIGMNEITQAFLKRVGVIVGAIFFFIIVLFFSIKKVQVWSAGLTGQAELAQADYNRRIVVQEAIAKHKAAIELAKAEIERAKGVAQANAIIGKSLEKNESYLRYLWIQNLANEKNQVIYVPTEGNLPLLEASRLKNMSH